MTDDNIRMGESIAVIQEQLRQIAADNIEARSARKAQYEQNERQSLTLLKIEHRLESVEKWMTVSDPTIQEIRNLKLKAEGAGKLGRFLWVIAGASIGAAAMAVSYWQKLFGGYHG